MLQKIKVYCDSGANLRILKKYRNHVILYQYPYDSENRPQNMEIQLAQPSDLQWRDAHTTWQEFTFPWDSCAGSEIYERLIDIVGATNRRDILHLDSAYKDKCDVFITSDKKDIFNNKEMIEPLCRFEIVHSGDEDSVIKCIERWIRSRGIKV